MLKIHYCGLFLFFGLIGIFSNTLTVEAYQATVVAYRSLQEPLWTPDQILPNNVNSYVKIINSTKADIIVFPEYGLTTDDVKNKPKEHLSDYSVIVEEKSNPCNNHEKYNRNLVKLSCAAKGSRKYTVLNVIETYGNDSYLTDIVLDAEGKIELKCRRNYVPLNSPFKNSTETSKRCTFNAIIKNKNITFLIIQDPDLLGSVPSDIGNVILTSATENSIPFEYAPALHSGFAVRNKVNLLVAGYVDVQKNYGGSGIYKIDNDRLIANATFGIPSGNEYRITEEVIVNEPVKKNMPIQVEVGLSPKTVLNLPFASVTVTNITDPNVSTECVKGICCTFKADGQTTIFPYKWVFFHDQTTMFGRSVNIIYCALIKPNQAAPSVMFTNVTISSTNETTVSQVLPIAIKNNNFDVPAYVYQETESTRTIYLSKQEELTSFGIIHISNSAAKVTIIGPSVLLVATLIWLIN